uniref:Uncharacterized protein n=1 Tax=Panagrolaimus davidi TaxID=227884 RepID=A0A914PRY0_9BILA
MSEPELSQYRASQRLLNPNSASSNRQHLEKQQSDDAQIAQQLYNAHLSDQGVKKQRPNNTQIVQQKYLSRSSLGMSNNHLNDTINSQRSYSSYVHNQPVLSHSFNYAISMHDFLKRIWIDLPELKSKITDFGLHAQLLKNAEKMEISKLTSCQSILMTLFFDGDRSLDYIVHAPHLSGVTVGVAFCMVNYVMDYKEYDHTFQKSFAPMVIVLCESDSDVYRTYLGFSKVAEKTGVSVYNIQQKPRKPQNVEKRKKFV